MTTITYQTDAQRRSLIGQLFNEDDVKKDIVEALSTLRTNLYNSTDNPIEQRINKILIPTADTYNNPKIDALLIAQTRSPLYEEIANIFVDKLQKLEVGKTQGLLDKRLRPFIANSLYSNRFDNSNLPQEIIDAMQPFQTPELVKDVLQKRLANLDEKVTKLTTQITANPLIRFNLYKFVAENYEKVEYLAETNPAVITMYIYTQDITKPIEHEGEVVKCIRDHFEERHPDYPLSDYWKAFSKRSHNSIYNHITACAQQSMDYQNTLCSELLIATTISGTEIQPGAHNWLDHLTDQRFNALGNRKQILMLLLKEVQNHPPDDEWFQGLNRQISDVTDYIRNMNPDANVNSTSWNGLLQRSDEWHRDQRAHANLRQHDPDTKKCWNSLIEEPIKFDSQKIIVTPLLSSIELYMESDEVQHCVRMYSEACSSGRSRIFKIRPMPGHEDRGKVGTMEIELNDSGWKVRQVRGIRNHPLTSSIETAAEHVAQAYTQKWNSVSTKDGEERHKSWDEKRDKEEEKEAVPADRWDNQVLAYPR